MWWLGLQTPILTASIIHIGFTIQRVLAPGYAVNGHMGPSLYCHACGGQGWNLGNVGAGLRPSNVVSKPLWTAFHIHTICTQIDKIVLAPWYAVNGHMSPPLHCYACAGWGWILGKLGLEWAQVMLLCDGWGSNTSWTASHIYTKCTQSETNCFSTLICCEWA